MNAHSLLIVYYFEIIIKICRNYLYDVLEPLLACTFNYGPNLLYREFIYDNIYLIFNACLKGVFIIEKPA